MSEQKNGPLDLRIFKDLWQLALSDDIEPILNHEISSYHKYCKNPDTGNRYRQFYSQLEPLHYESARNFFEKKLKSNYFSIRKSCKINHYSIFITLKGTIELAHGEVLKRQLQLLSDEEKLKVVVIMINYNAEIANKISVELGIKCVGIYAENRNLISSYLNVVMLLTSSSARRIRVIWWGIPFGMIFTYTLLAMLQSEGYLFDQRITKEFVTVKHKYSWNPAFLDLIHTGYSIVEGFEDPSPVKIKYSALSAYRKEDMLPQQNTEFTESSLVQKILSLKRNGYIVLTSASRDEKIINKNHFDLLRSIFESAEGIIYLSFSVNNNFKNLFKKNFAFSNSNGIVNVGWVNNVVDYIGLCDLFVDPIPFGAGMTFVSAALQSKVCLSTSQYVHKSPSTIARINYYYNKRALNIDDKLVETYLLGPVSSYGGNIVQAINKLRNSNDEIREYASLLRAAVEELYCKDEKSLIV